MDSKFSMADQQSEQNLRVMRPDIIGDELMPSPALRARTEAVPQEEINETSLLSLRKDMLFLEELQKRRFSMAVIFSGVSQSPWLSEYAAYFAGIPHRLGIAKDDNGSTEDIEKTANDLLRENGIEQGSAYIIFAPEASVAADCYDPDHFAAAARILAAQTELQIIVVGSSEEVEAVQPLLQLAQENVYGNVHSLVGKITFPELAVVIRQASLTITGRSAIMRMVDTAQCPMVVLYPESDCHHGMRFLDIRPEEIAIAALELLEEQTYSPRTYHVLQGYRSDLSET